MPATVKSTVQRGFRCASSRLSFSSSEPFACIRVLADGRAGPDAKAPSRTSSTEAYVNILERLIEHFVEAKPLAALGMKHDDRHDRSPGRGMHGSFAGNP